MSMLVPEVIVFRPAPKALALVNALSIYEVSAIEINSFSCT